MSKDKEEIEETIEIRYNPIGDQPFGLEEMLAQSASSLDLAALIALNRDDVDALIRVGEGWTKLAEVMSSIESEQLPKKPVIKFGFRPEEPEEEGEDGRTDEDQGISANHNQPGKLRKRRY